MRRQPVRSHLKLLPRLPILGARVWTFLIVMSAMLVSNATPSAFADLTREQAQAAMHKAIQFYQTKVSVNGGYLWQYSSDLKEREGEGKASATQAWVQPPGTPSMGEAFLEGYLLTSDKVLLEAAKKTAYALVNGQLVSGGWDYRIEFDAKLRNKQAYRVENSRQSIKNSRIKNVTTLDDNTTQSAMSFLIKIDRVLNFKDSKIHSAVVYGLDALVQAQYPNGAWAQRFSEFPDPKSYPVKKAAFPDSWSRTHPKVDYRSYYTFNDNTLADMIDLMFLAGDLIDKKYTRAALRAADFILLAQLPEPQPAWAQQYNAKMQPAWARRFEPPAVTGGESQGVIRILMTVYRQTGDAKYLKPIPRALAYLKKSELPDGRIPRFLEVRTNRPLYFTTKYELTYKDDDLPTHYGFQVGSKIDRLKASYEKILRSPGPKKSPWNSQRKKPSPGKSLEKAAESVAKAMDTRGAWTERGQLRGKGNSTAEQPVISTTTFIANLRTLARFVAAE
jgi:PelA/Pel-15E family pectate lyase